MLKILSDACSAGEYPCGFPSCLWLRCEDLEGASCNAGTTFLGGAMLRSRFAGSARRTGAFANLAL